MLLDKIILHKIFRVVTGIMHSAKIFKYVLKSTSFGFRLVKQGIKSLYMITNAISADPSVSKK